MWIFALTLIYISTGGKVAHGVINTCYRDNHGWIYDKYCLEIVLPQKTWYSARNYCSSRGGDLVEVRTPQIQNSIASHLRIYNGRYKGFWIGATDTESEGWWRWLHNPRGMSWSYWSPDEGPNHGFLFGGYPDDCAIIRTDANFKWFDSPCDGVVDALHYSFICQYVMATTTTTSKPTTTTPKPATTPKPKPTTTTPKPTTLKPTTTPTPSTTTPKPTTAPKPTTTTTTTTQSTETTHIPTTTTTTPKPTTKAPKPTTTTTTPKPTTTSKPTTTTKTTPQPTTTTPKPTTVFVEPTEKLETTVSQAPTECLESMGCFTEITEPTKSPTTEPVGVIIG